MDLREKMAMLRMEQGQATEHDKALIFGTHESEAIEPVQTVEPIEEPVEEVEEKPKKKFEDVARAKTEALRQPSADKRIEITLAQQLTVLIKQLTSEEFIDKIATRVVEKIDDSLKA